MFEALVFILISSFYASLVIWGMMLIFRAYIAITSKLNIKQKALVFILPCGYGVFRWIKNDKAVSIYRIFVIALFVTSFLASLFLFHRVLGL